jgi:hypothetical protein
LWICLLILSDLLEYPGCGEVVTDLHVPIIVNNGQKEDRGLLEHVLCLHISVHIVVQNFQHGVELLGKCA